MKSSTYKKPTNLFIILGLAIFLSNIIVFSSLLIAANISWGLSVLSSIMFSLLLIVCSIFFKELSLSWVALIAVITSLLCGMYISDYADLQGRQIVEKISIKDAINYQEAAGYTFTDGFVKTELGVTYKKSHTDSKGHTSISYYYAAPVIYEGWNTSKPVTVFAVASISPEKKDWKLPFRAGIRAPKTFHDELKTAVNKCIRINNLKQNSQTVMIKWVKSPAEAIKKYKSDMLSTLLIWNIVMVLGIIIFRFIYFIKFRKSSLDQTEPDNSKKVTKDSVIRMIFTFFIYYLMIFSLYFSGFDFSNMLTIFLLIIGLVFYIISTAALHTAHKKEERKYSDLIYFALYPFFVYFLTFFKLDFDKSSLWLFIGFFYFFIITGGFIFGILFSPLIAKRERNFKSNIQTNLDKGKKILKFGKIKLSISLLFGGIFTVLAIIFLNFVETVQKLEPFRIIIFMFLLIIGIFIIIKFTYRHTYFGLSKNPTLQRKYQK